MQCISVVNMRFGVCLAGMGSFTHQIRHDKCEACTDILIIEQLVWRTTVIAEILELGAWSIVARTRGSRRYLQVGAVVCSC